jgi:guanine deaminase
MAHPTDIRTAHRGAVLTFLSDPGEQDSPQCYNYWPDGAFVVAGGRIQSIGPSAQVLPSLPSSVEVIEHGRRLLVPGFIDTHIHYPQTDVIGSGGRNLLDWLENYTFPAEARFADVAYARQAAEFFLDELLDNGTTTAQVFGTVHQCSIDAFFEAANARQLRMIAGKVLMDRNAPDYLLDTASDGERETLELIDRWHGRDRLHYAITPRFAPTSTPEQLASAGRMARDYPDVFIHSHVAENRHEIDWVKQLFPDARSYLDVYDRFNLLRERAIYAHCIHLDRTDRERMAQAGACAAFSPSSNLYLGSGLFDLAATDAAGMQFALATDVGGGTTFSMLRTMGEAYKVAQMQGQRLSALRAFYLATLGGARALRLDQQVGRLAPGCEADFLVLDLEATPLLARRTAQSTSLSEQLLLLMTLGDDRCIAGTYILGQRARIRSTQA